MPNINALAQTELQLQQHYKLHLAKQDALSLELNALCHIKYKVMTAKICIFYLCQECTSAPNFTEIQKNQVENCTSLC
jgi:hypothetical protein